jgi:hypothetical protein
VLHVYACSRVCVCARVLSVLLLGTCNLVGDERLIVQLVLPTYICYLPTRTHTTISILSINLSITLYDVMRCDLM